MIGITPLFLRIHVLTFMTIPFFKPRKFGVCSESAGMAVVLTAKPQNLLLKKFQAFSFMFKTARSFKRFFFPKFSPTMTAMI